MPFSAIYCALFGNFSLFQALFRITFYALFGNFLCPFQQFPVPFLTMAVSKRGTKSFQKGHKNPKTVPFLTTKTFQKGHQ